MGSDQTDPVTTVPSLTGESLVRCTVCGSEADCRAELSHLEDCPETQPQ
jgi:hypothetical protein